MAPFAVGPLIAWNELVLMMMARLTYLALGVKGFSVRAHPYNCIDKTKAMYFLQVRVTYLDASCDHFAYQHKSDLMTPCESVQMSWSA